MNRVPAQPGLLRWARERSRRDLKSLLKPFPKLEAWECGELQPTLKQLERFARATHTPIGYLFLQAPPVERIPIPDFRTVATEYSERPSPDLLDMLYLCQQRQDCYRGFALADPLAPLVFVNGADTKAAQMFTLAHELAHVWLGQTAVSDTQALAVPHQQTESWCNRVAAELLVPLDMLLPEYDDSSELRSELDRLARRFKVSSI